METLYRVESPVANDIEVMVKGVIYKLPAGGVCENIPSFAMEHWKSLHAFLSFEKMPVKVVETKVVEPKTKKEEKVEESTVTGSGTVDEKGQVTSSEVKVEKKGVAITPKPRGRAK